MNILFDSKTESFYRHLIFHNKIFVLNNEFLMNEFIKKREEQLLYFKRQILNLLTKNSKMWYIS